MTKAKNLEIAVFTIGVAAFLLLIFALSSLFVVFPDSALAATSAVSCRPGQKIGDLNDDALIDWTDVELASGVYNGDIVLPDSFCCLDIDSDNQFEYEDVLEIRDIAIAWVEQNPLIQSPGNCDCLALPEGQSCPVFGPPHPSWCSDGQQISGGVNEYCCQQAPLCIQRTCSDTDGGMDYDVQGVVTEQFGSVTHTQTDSCYQNTVTEYYCGDDNTIQGTTYACPNGCSDGACQAAALPDLAVTDMRFYKFIEPGTDEDQINQPGVINIWVKNLGGPLTSAAGIGNFSLNGDFGDDITWTSDFMITPDFPTPENPMLTNDITLFRRNGYFTKERLYNFTFRVNSNGELEEQDTTNNSLSKKFAIYDPAIPNCTETDGGDNKYVKGTLTGAHWVNETIYNNIPDQCNGNVLTEYYCRLDPDMQKSYALNFDYTCTNGCDGGACKATGLKPDLEIQEIKNRYNGKDEPIPSVINLGDTLALEIIVKNIGTIFSDPTKISITADGVFLGEPDLAGILNGGSGSNSDFLEWTPTQTKTYRLGFDVDPTNIIDELDETNNHYEIFVEVADGGCTPGQTQQCGATNIGACEYGTQTCQANGIWGSCIGAVGPTTEVCGDGIDNDCDGVTDEGCLCTPGQTEQCGTSNIGECQLGTRTCLASGSGWSVCDGAIYPTQEICSDGLDNDCDGAIDGQDSDCLAGILNITKAASSPSSALLPGNTNGLTVGVMNMSAQNEDIQISKIYITAAQINSGGWDQVDKLYLYEGSNMVGSAIPTTTDGINRTALFEYLSLQIPANTNKDLTLKVDTADVNYSAGSKGEAGQGYKLKIASKYDVVAFQAGLPGKVIYPQSLPIFNSFLLYRSVPTVAANEDLGAEAVASGTLSDGTEVGKNLYRFKLTADNAGDVALYRATFLLHQNNASVSNLVLYDGTGNVAAAVEPTVDPTYLGTGDMYSFVFTNDGTLPDSDRSDIEPYTVSGGASKTFTLRGDVTCDNSGSTPCAGSGGEGSINIQFVGDIPPSPVYPASTLYFDDNFSSGKLVWSDLNRTLTTASTTAITAEQWTNAYLVKRPNGSYLPSISSAVSFTKGDVAPAPVAVPISTSYSAPATEDLTQADPTYLALKEKIASLEIIVTELEREVVELERALTTQIDTYLTQQLQGNILLQVEENGEAWYLDPDTDKRFYLKDGDSAYSALQVFGLGITNADLAKIPIGIEERADTIDTDGDGLDDRLEDSLGTDLNNPDTDGDGFLDGNEVRDGYNPLGPGTMPYQSWFVSLNNLEGRILLQVESHGEAWYVNPTDGKRYYMKDGDLAYQIMRFLSLGITNDNLRKIDVGEF